MDSLWVFCSPAAGLGVKHKTAFSKEEISWMEGEWVEVQIKADKDELAKSEVEQKRLSEEEKARPNNKSAEGRGDLCAV